MITICKIVAKYKSLEYDIKFALNEYIDHEDSSQYVSKLTNLTTAKNIIEALKLVKIQGGGDGPEAVMDGLYYGIRDTQWRVALDGEIKSKRIIFHICDAPPHGNKFESNLFFENYPKGCPCGKNERDI